MRLCLLAILFFLFFFTRTMTKTITSTSTVRPTAIPMIIPRLDPLEPPVSSGVVVVVEVVTILTVTLPDSVVWQVTETPSSTVVTPSVVQLELDVSYLMQTAVWITVVVVRRFLILETSHLKSTEADPSYPISPSDSVLSSICTDPFSNTTLSSEPMIIFLVLVDSFRCIVLIETLEDPALKAARLNNWLGMLHSTVSSPL